MSCVMILNGDIQTFRTLCMQILNSMYANRDFFKTPHIQIWFLGKDLVFKYESLSTFICPWMHCLQKGPYFKDLLLNKDLFGILGPYLYFRVLIFSILGSFTQRMSIQSHICRHWFRLTLLANFDFYLCLRVLILAAGGPYWVLIS